MQSEGHEKFLKVIGKLQWILRDEMAIEAPVDQR
jgi:hypothetical protein